MTAMLECGPIGRAMEPSPTVRVRLGSGSTTKISAHCWEQAARLRRQLHHQGWICTSPSPSVGQNEFTFFVTKGPATIRRDLRNDLESLSEVEILFEEIDHCRTLRLSGVGAHAD